MIVGAIDYTGSIELGHQIKMGYYAQNQADFLDEEITVLTDYRKCSNRA